MWFISRTSLVSLIFLLDDRRKHKFVTESWSLKSFCFRNRNRVSRQVELFFALYQTKGVKITWILELIRLKSKASVQL